jgi:(4S)-4-hydroxy-5-phosphonooxypentane-2,3-dione isomerase
VIIRIVKMEFEPTKVETFLDLFHTTRDKIANSQGCLGLELLNDIGASNRFFTHSMWESEQDLENYRNSELFKQTWLKTKVMFNNKPEAWSLNPIKN